VKTYIEELLTTFSDFHQTVFSFLTAHSLQQLFPQLTPHSNFFHSHSPTKQTLSHITALQRTRNQGFLFPRGQQSITQKQKDGTFFPPQLSFSSSVSLEKNGHIANYCAISG
jgi:hypothetical protein